MLSCFFQGGLGNQMFQISATVALALDNNDTACFDFNVCDLPYNGRHSINYKDNVYKNLSPSENFIVSNIYNEPAFHYTPIKYQPNTLLVGYFQSEKYFERYKKEIMELFEPSQETLNYITQKYPILTDDDVNTVSIHVRRTDYLKFKHVHPVCTIEYYKNAIKYLAQYLDSILDNKKNVFMVFSDDILWCKENFNYLENIIYIEDEIDYIDMYIMSLCKHNIIANSSFSWWGAYLNQYRNKKVIAPSVWFGENKKDINTKDIYCDNWRKI